MQSTRETPDASVWPVAKSVSSRHLARGRLSTYLKEDRHPTGPVSLLKYWHCAEEWPAVMRLFLFIRRGLFAGGQRVDP